MQLKMMGAGLGVVWVEPVGSEWAVSWPEVWVSAATAAPGVGGCRPARVGSAPRCPRHLDYWKMAKGKKKKIRRASTADTKIRTLTTSTLRLLVLHPPKLFLLFAGLLRLCFQLSLSLLLLPRRPSELFKAVTGRADGRGQR